MKKKMFVCSPVVFLTLIALVVLIASNWLLGIWSDSFDKYKFIEELYKAIFNVISNAFIVTYCVKKVSSHVEHKRIKQRISSRLKRINFILNAIQQQDTKSFIKGLESFCIENELHNSDYPQYDATVYFRKIIINSNFILQSIDNFSFSSSDFNEAVRNIEKYSNEYSRILREYNIDLFR